MFTKEPAKAKVVCENGRYLLQAGKESAEIPAELASKEELAALAGQTVDLVYSEPRRWLVALRPVKRPPILCYLPIRPRPTCYIMPPDLGHPAIADVIRQARAQLLEQLLQNRMLSAADYKRLVRKPLCYIPVPELAQRVSDAVRRTLADRLLQEAVISKDVHAKLV